MAEQVTGSHIAKQEIERKFLVDKVNLPIHYDRYSSFVIRQGYLAIGEDGSEVRLRNKNGKLILGAKNGTGISRAEEETILDPETFDRFWLLTEGREVLKTRFELPYISSGGNSDILIEPEATHTIELDLFRGKLGELGLILAEVEFKDLDDANNFEPPEWFGREVTENPAYNNQALALREKQLREAAAVSEIWVAQFGKLS